MNDILDYLDWRGDIAQETAEYNDVDYYIISKIGCPDLSGIVPADSGTVSIAQAAEEYFIEDGRPLGILSSQHILDVFKKLPAMKRFSGLKLSGYMMLRSERKTEQFSALTIILPNDDCFISFRGTDDTLNAWKEDLELAVKDCVYAQKDALDYLNWAAEQYDGRLIIGGHSKGGNLAVYAASMAPAEVQCRIRAVYCFDGPGFKPEFYTESAYEAISGRLHDIVPETSIVGMLLDKAKEPEIVGCSKKGIASHDGYVWHTSPKGFIRKKSLSQSSIALNEATSQVLQEMSEDETEQMIEQLFDALGGTGAKTITELAEQRLSSSIEVLKNLRSAHMVRSFSFRLLDSVIKCMVEHNLENL